jgi:hypothetical protein
MPFAIPNGKPKNDFAGGDLHIVSDGIVSFTFRPYNIFVSTRTGKSCNAIEVGGYDTGQRASVKVCAWNVA